MRDVVACVYAPTQAPPNTEARPQAARTACRNGPYRRMTDADADALRAEFETHGRSHVLGLGERV